jgi:hypothetical protein
LHGREAERLRQVRDATESLCLGGGVLTRLARGGGGGGGGGGRASASASSMRRRRRTSYRSSTAAPSSLPSTRRWPTSAPCRAHARRKGEPKKTASPRSSPLTKPLARSTDQRRLLSWAGAGGAGVGSAGSGGQKARSSTTPRRKGGVHVRSQHPVVPATSSPEEVEATVAAGQVAARARSLG